MVGNRFISKVKAILKRRKWLQHVCVCKKWDWCFRISTWRFNSIDKQPQNDNIGEPYSKSPKIFLSNLAPDYLSFYCWLNTLGGCVYKWRVHLCTKVKCYLLRILWLWFHFLADKSRWERFSLIVCFPIKNKYCQKLGLKYHSSFSQLLFKTLLRTLDSTNS